MSALPASTCPRWEILQPGGPFHGNEIRPDLSLHWYGLFPNGDGFSVSKIHLQIRRERDPILDNGSRKTGKRVVTDRAEDFIFLVGTSCSLPSGKAGGVPLGHDFLDPASPVRFNFLGRDYKLSSEGSLRLAPSERWWLKNRHLDRYRILLTGNGMTQVLFETESLFRGSLLTEPGGHPYLEWAGDLDGDGKVDLLLNEGRENMLRWILFLSSEAKEGELIGKVADLTTTGC